MTHSMVQRKSMQIVTLFFENVHNHFVFDRFNLNFSSDLIEMRTQPLVTHKLNGRIDQLNSIKNKQ